MHILFLPSWYPANESDLAGTFFREQAEAFLLAGHRVGVLNVRGIAVYSRSQLRGRKSGIRHFLDSGFDTYLWDRVLPFPKVPGGNERILLNAWRTLLHRYIDDNGRPDVLHAHTMFPAGLVTHALSEEFKIPFIVTEHRISSLPLLAGRWNGPRGRAAAKAASALVAVAPDFAPALDQAYGLSKWEYVPGLLSPQFEDITVRPTPNGPFTFGHVSYMDPHKNVDLLIHAFADRFHGDPDVRLRIAGHSSFTQDLIDLAASRGISDQVDFVGAVPRSGIVGEFSRYHAFVMPSRTEAFGTVLWEAMACGLPLVSTDTWAGRNAVREGNGLLVGVEQRDELGEALVSMRKTFADYDPHHIRSICVNHCARDAFVGQYSKLYADAVAA
ncbi:glycosyltransferase [Specibacter cremeus]|uniref:glycosyltransferase n=1 Tax=Specibacter cremeus TaxID=1629051 RepID=UPI0013DDC557|nr:glycosyltransferase [Specibacter cremeus]